MQSTASAPLAKKPVHKEAWFWIVIVGVAGIILASILAFGFTLLMISSSSPSYGYGMHHGYPGASGPSFDMRGVPNGPYGSGCERQGYGGRAFGYGCERGLEYDYDLDDWGIGGTMNPYDRSSDSTVTPNASDPFSQFPEDIQEDLRQYHQGLEGYQELQPQGHGRQWPHSPSSDL